MAVEQEPRHKKARTRSPAYPYLALPEALEKAGQLWRAESRHAVSVNVAMQHWGYKMESSTGYSCIAALKKFGLVDEEGVGENREVKLSNLALTILLDEANSPERAAALRVAALSPRIHAELWERYGADLPSDQSLKRFLVVEKNFNEASVDEFVAEYRGTIAFANLQNGVPPTPKPLPGNPWRDEPAVSSGYGRERPRETVRNARPDSAQEETLWSGKPGAEFKPAPTPPGSGTRPEGAGTARASQEPNGNRPAGESGRTVELPFAPAVGEPRKELPVPLDNDLVARVPYPMTEEDFSLLIATLQLWKKRLVRPKE